MSLRAYRIIQIKMAKKSSFNLWHEKKLIQFLDESGQFFGNISSNGSGLVDVPVEMLEDALAISDDLNLSEKTAKLLRKDIEAANYKKEECITYYCF